MTRDDERSVCGIDWKQEFFGHRVRQNRPVAALWGMRLGLKPELELCVCKPPDADASLNQDFKMEIPAEVNPMTLRSESGIGGMRAPRRVNRSRIHWA